MTVCRGRRDHRWKIQREWRRTERSHEIVDLLKRGDQCVYAGFDPTADSLHVGNLLVLVNLLHWQRAGHRVVVLLGGATGLIGDPSGRSSARPALSEEEVERNTRAIRDNVERIFSNHRRFLWTPNVDLPEVRFVNNLEWYGSLSAVRLVATAGRHARMAAMLSRHSVQARLSSEAGMSFAEFCYQLFQAYDWLELARRWGCRFQVGGSDQMGNMVSGHDLVSRVAGTPVYALTVPLVTTEAGDKFGKSAGNAVWLDPGRTSPFELYQFLVRVRDSDVERMLKLFTFKPLASVAALMELHQAQPEQRTAQKRLAEQVTLLVHGEEGLRSAREVSAALYEGSLEALARLSTAAMGQVLRGAELRELPLRAGATVLDVAMQARCFPSEGDARRIIGAGGFYVNHQRACNTEEVLSRAAHVLPNNVTLLRVGKKNYYIVKWLT
ncbi:tyrosine--tRNA ligase, mitochondrial isoform X1 [Bacillus rossius redtenbacheri]|uniref:tyrosine--tRNA ligase, mitochondrial isoform X1 n=1 Tax=Bacillus rossius redtenbacheri TaxID=93214 RepID=UPI002FDCE11B